MIHHGFSYTRLFHDDFLNEWMLMLPDDGTPDDDEEATYEILPGDRFDLPDTSAPSGPLRRARH